MLRPRAIAWIVALLIVGGPITYFAVMIPPLKDTTVTHPVPAWAKVAPEQIAEAKEHGVPVAFENSLGMRFVLVPAGKFVMGSPEDEEGRQNDETQHEVTITKPYYMQVTEVTNGQYRHCVRDHDSGGDGDGDLDQDEQPVVRVTWEDAAAFAEWLSRMDARRSYALPTEAQWEYACRAGSTTRFSFGDRPEDLVRYANFADRNHPSEQGLQHLDDGHGVNAPVGSYLPSTWGLYDMHGNVWEWCADGHEKNLGAVEVTDPMGPETGRDHITRGGAWYNHPPLLRSAYRAWFAPGKRGFDIGFRLVCHLPNRDDGT